MHLTVDFNQLINAFDFIPALILGGTLILSWAIFCISVLLLVKE